MNVAGMIDAMPSEPMNIASAPNSVSARCRSAHSTTRRYQRMTRPSRSTCGLAFSWYAAIIGVSSRATSSENSTAVAAVQPNSRKNLPATPGMNATGTNTAASVADVAITARPISSAASIAACFGGLPIARCRSMFSTSTIASSTRMPTTTASASSVTMFRLKSNSHITPKVGMIDSGSATAEIHVARQSRRKNHTTSTASSAPS